MPQTLDEAPRFEAAAWLKAHVPHGALVVNENYGPWLDSNSFDLTHVSYALAVVLPPNAWAIILTDEGSGRFMGDAKTYPAQAAVYQGLMAHYCVSAKFTNGPWVEVLTPCG